MYVQLHFSQKCCQKWKKWFSIGKKMEGITVDKHDAVYNKEAAAIQRQAQRRSVIEFKSLPVWRIKYNTYVCT
jgi:hypothetical protein